ncbi:CPLD46 [Auxenochlorella protothecoides x Auxenochlorella symbiontica]
MPRSGCGALSSPPTVCLRRGGDAAGARARRAAAAKGRLAGPRSPRPKQDVPKPRPTSGKTARQKEQDPTDAGPGFARLQKFAEALEGLTPTIDRSPTTTATADVGGQLGSAELNNGRKIAERKREPVEMDETTAALAAQFPFQLDDFQIKAIKYIVRGRSVVVSAPTGSGKTAIAEACMRHFLGAGRRIIYTTPLKALSNQKLVEMRQRFGVEVVGLQTGDASVNIAAPLVIMTTEILRNQLYRSRTMAPDGVEGAEAATDAAGDDDFEDVALVVLDEVHYLGDPWRGSVWEEVLINLPPHILVLGMSATVKNPGDLAGWIRQVHGECSVVSSTYRPVPLTWHYCHADAELARARLKPLLARGGRRLHPSLVHPSARGKQGEAGAAAAGGQRGRRVLDELVSVVERTEEDDWLSVPRARRVPSMAQVVRLLNSKGMLPALWFCFSRRECDLCAIALPTQGIDLTTPKEREAIQRHIDLAREGAPEAVREDLVPSLLAGIASHHAGCLPAWKTLVEHLFQQGLLKLVIATETLAAGINMPARTSLISTMTRRSGEGFAALRHNDLQQMAGRAGRRGYDTEGHCVVVASKWDEPSAAWEVLKGGPEPLESQFSAGYSMALSLLATRSLPDARAFLHKSFLRYMGGAATRQRLAEVAALERAAEDLRRELGAADGAGSEPELWQRFRAAQEAARSAKAAGRRLRAAVRTAHGGAMAERVAEARRETPCPAVALDLEGRLLDPGAGPDSLALLPAWLLGPSEVDGEDDGWEAAADAAPGPPRYVCLGADNRLYDVPAHALAGVHPSVPGGPPPSLARGSSVAGAGWTAAGPQAPSALTAPGTKGTAGWTAALPGPGAFEVARPDPGTLRALRACADDLAAAQRAQREAKAHAGFRRAARGHERAARRLARVEESVAEARGELPDARDATWRAFKRLLGVLGKFGALDMGAAAVGAALLACEGTTGGPEVDGRTAAGAGGGGAAAHGAQVSGAASRGAGIDGVAPSQVQTAKHDATSEGRMGDTTPKGTPPTPPRSIPLSPLGEAARQLHGGNELWLALALTHAALQDLAPEHLAGALAALAAGDALSRPGLRVAYPAAPAAAAALEALEGARLELERAQAAAGVEVPVTLDARVAGLAQAWAAGASWAQLAADSSLDDGDVARLLMRTVDLARQAAHCEQLLPELRAAARKVVRAMDRSPISDLVH